MEQTEATTDEDLSSPLFAISAAESFDRLSDSQETAIKFQETGWLDWLAHSSCGPGVAAIAAAATTAALELASQLARWL